MASSWNWTGTYLEAIGEEGTTSLDSSPEEEWEPSVFEGGLRNYIPAGTRFHKVEVGIRWKSNASKASSCNLYIGGTRVASGETGSSNVDTWSGNVVGYFQSGTANAGLPNDTLNATFYSGSGLLFRKYTYRLMFRWYPQWLITVNGGTGGGYHNMGSTFTITATPSTGYKFVKWSDGVTTISRSITVTGNATYTAVFEKIYVTYDSIFSFKRWADNGIGTGSGVSISNLSDVGFTGTALVDDAYTSECRPLIPVTNGQTYIFECDTSGGNFEFFIFNCNSSGAWSNFTYGNTNKFNFTATTDYVSIRCDIVGTGTVVNFSNFRMYPADCPYMSTSVSTAERTDVVSWSMPTPTRQGYKFKGWNTKADGSGTTYTSSSTFPVSDLALYSQWEVDKINKILAEKDFAKKVLCDLDEVKAILIDKTKIYG